MDKSDAGKRELASRRLREKQVSDLEEAEKNQQVDDTRAAEARKTLIQRPQSEGNHGQQQLYLNKNGTHPKKQKAQSHSNIQQQEPYLDSNGGQEKCFSTDLPITPQLVALDDDFDEVDPVVLNPWSP